ncbi:UNVERIFIED_CONTAM: hypothetical protein OHV15_08305 [Microbacterium sp. SLM126]
MTPLPTLWDGYSVIELPFSPVPPRGLSRAQARQFFGAMMDLRDSRIEELRGLVERNGYPADSNEEVQRSVVDFINAHAQAEPTPADTGFDLGPLHLTGHRRSGKQSGWTRGSCSAPRSWPRSRLCDASC